MIIERERWREDESRLWINKYGRRGNRDRWDRKIIGKIEIEEMNMDGWGKEMLGNLRWEKIWNWRLGKEWIEWLEKGRGV